MNADTSGDSQQFAATEPTTAETTTSQTTPQATPQFAGLALVAALAKAIAKMGFTQPTPIQEKAIPLILKGQDTISLAETGSGKTAAYLIPVLSHLLENRDKQALILAPTRELATQIGDVVYELTHFAHEIRHAVVIGGAPMFKQIKQLQRKPAIIVATPGRLVDHIRRGSVDLKKISHLIIDEADRMFDMGFAPQVNEVVRRLPTERQTLLFSATFPNEVRDLANRVLRKPVEIEVRKNALPPKVITQKLIPVAGAKKNEMTLDLINAATGSVIIFTRTKNRTDRLSRFLADFGVAVTHIHGDRSQGQRNKAIHGFKSGEFKVMVATDIAARGLDVSDISDVINYDIPMTPDDYVHRIGRTGRAGQEGQALTLMAPDEVNDWAYIARKMNLPLPAGAKGTQKPTPHHRRQGHGLTHGKPSGGGYGGQKRHGKGGGGGGYKSGGYKGGGKPSGGGHGGGKSHGGGGGFRKPGGGGGKSFGGGGHSARPQ